jgi:hypothetical protein
LPEEWLPPEGRLPTPLLGRTVPEWARAPSECWRTLPERELSRTSAPECSRALLECSRTLPEERVALLELLRLELEC